MRLLALAAIIGGLAAGACTSSAATSNPTSTTGARPASPSTAPSTPPSATSEPPASSTIAATSTATPDTATPTTLATTTTLDPALAERPFRVIAPRQAVGDTPLPVVLALHGYTADSATVDAVMGLSALVDTRQFLLILPDGTKDSLGNRFWEATDACCDFQQRRPDDSAYLLAVIRQVQADYRVDQRRIYVMGHSNGGFMSYRMACDHADVIAGIISLAGATFADATDCSPAGPVSIVQVHGTADDAIRYTGGTSINGFEYPAAEQDVAIWASYNGCGGELSPVTPRLDLDVSLPGDDTIVSRYSGCPAGVDVELWTIVEGAHTPSMSTEFAARAIDFLLSHPKP